MNLSTCMYVCMYYMYVLYVCVYMYVCILFIRICYVLQNYGLFKQGRIHCINFSVPEVKILILLSYYMIMGTLSLANFTVSIKNASLFLDDVFRYFACQEGGFDPMCEDIRQQFEKHLKPGLNGATYFTVAMIPWVYLLFIIQAENVKGLFQRIKVCYDRASAKALPSEISLKPDATI